MTMRRHFGGYAWDVVRYNEVNFSMIGGWILDHELYSTEVRIRGVLKEQARLVGEINSLGIDDDLFAAGMTSHASVGVMLALEDEFDLEFPDEMLNRSSFSTIRSIADAVSRFQVPD